jgi:hypothetical protein
MKRTASALSAVLAFLVSGAADSQNRTLLQCDQSGCRPVCRSCSDPTSCPPSCGLEQGGWCAQQPISDDQVANFQYLTTCDQDCGPANCSTATMRCLPNLSPGGDILPGQECAPKGCRLSPKPGDFSRFNKICGPTDGRGEPSVGGNKGSASLQCPVGGVRSVADPVSIAEEKSVYTVTDGSLRTPSGVIEFTRTFHSTRDEWLSDDTLGTQSTPYIPTPFGGDWSIRWWHNWYAFVFRTSADWFVRLPGGELVVFEPCTVANGQSSCAARPRSRSAESRATLRWSTSLQAFTYYGPTGSYRFSSRHGTERFYLDNVVPRPGSGKATAGVQYAAPTGCTTTPGIDASGNLETLTPHRSFRVLVTPEPSATGDKPMHEAVFTADVVR